VQGAVKEKEGLSQRSGRELIHYGEELHILHNIMFKNAYLQAFPDKGLDDASPLSMCRKYRYVIQVGAFT
jgi:hypothetical protein